MKKFVLIFMLTAVFMSAPSQADFVINGEPSDQLATTDGGLQFVGQTSSRVGFNSAATSSAVGAFVFVMQLPDLGGETIDSADLGFHLRVNNAFSTFNADLYGVRNSSSNSVLTSDYFSGANDVTATKVQDNILFPAVSSTGVLSPSVAINTDGTGDIGLGAWISAQYVGGAVAGDYVFLRLNVDADTGNNNFYYEVETANSATPAYRPVLTLVTSAVPEPSSMVLLGLGGLAVIYARRQKNS